MRFVKKGTNDNNSPLTFVYKGKKGNHEELPNHIHDWYELIYINEGDKWFFIDQNFYHFQPGDILLVPPNTIHRAILKKNEFIVTTVMFFSPKIITQWLPTSENTFLNLFNQARAEREYRYRMELNHLLEFEKLLEEIHEEYEGGKDDRYEYLLVQLHSLLLFINRCCTYSHTQNANRKSEWIYPILTYIDERTSQSLSLEELAQHVSVTPAYLSKVFKQTLGMTLSEYITTKRLKLAKDMLCQTSENIETIAENCGFYSMPHFYRTFKKHTQLTPRQYRQRG
ncbi:AraC family transcriptional regulator [Alteribacillus sp. HJP-4]|uniref:AraC family transcriptional regulator n=1 Tax=Alteribacillus sp. HJP-4 TaxID=2775394 RepID=UPI0035CCED01